MTTAWWWYPFISEGPHSGRGMRVPTRAQCKKLAEIEGKLAQKLSVDLNSELGRSHVHNLLYLSVYEFLVSRDNEEQDDPWKGVDNMWDLFFSQLAVWIEAGKKELEYKKQRVPVR